MKTRPPLSGLEPSDELSCWVGKFVIYFSYLEFRLWRLHDILYGERESMKSFYRMDIPGRVRAIKEGVKKLSTFEDSAKELFTLLNEVSGLADIRNLVAHNPCLSAVGVREHEYHRNIILGIRKPSLVEGADMPEADVRKVESLARKAFALGERFNSLLGYVGDDTPFRING